MSETGRTDRVKVKIGSSAIELKAQLGAPGRVVINQAYLPGFTSELGRVYEDVSGLITMDLPAGRHHGTIDYRPWPQILGLLGSLVAGLGWCVAFWRLRRRSRS